MSQDYYFACLEHRVYISAIRFAGAGGFMAIPLGPHAISGFMDEHDACMVRGCVGLLSEHSEPLLLCEEVEPTPSDMPFDRARWGDVVVWKRGSKWGEALPDRSLREAQ